MIALLLALGCTPDDKPKKTKMLTREELLDPQSCADCHPQHVKEWSGSMHAYAAEDPVFLAMNARGQRETGGELGDFCVSCHAPMAVREGATVDGLDLDLVDPKLKGVTCAFCHLIDEVTDDHNASVDLSPGLALRAGLEDPTPNTAHKSVYSPLHDRNEIGSSDMCGSCHDIVTPNGLELERTFAEWKGTIYAHDEPGLRQTCGSCHMQGRYDVAADYEGVELRRVHRHTFAGVDVALTPFPEAEAQLNEVQGTLDTVLGVDLQVCSLGRNSQVVVTLENVAAGHSWPSGAAQDRRVWVELVAERADEVFFETGVVADGEPVPKDDEHLWRLGDTMLDDSEQEVHQFWEATSLTSTLLTAPTAFDLNDPAYTETHYARVWELDGMPDKVTVKVHIRPIGLDVLDDLIGSGDLDPAVREAMPTFTLGAATRTWTLIGDGDCW
jgi:hypothetical protein